MIAAGSFPFYAGDTNHPNMNPVAISWSLDTLLQELGVRPFFYTGLTVHRRRGGWDFRALGFKL